MELLRWILFFGLLVHKAVWEIMKRIYPNPNARKHNPRRPFLGAIKGGKIALLGFFLIQTLFLDVLPISDEPQTIQTAGIVLFLIGLTTAVVGRIHIGTNWVDLEEYQLLEHQYLVTNGIYGILRHPIYMGDLLLLIGLELALNSWLMLGVLLLIPVIAKQVRAEEALLSSAFSEYKNYSQRTARFIPFIL